MPRPWHKKEAAMAWGRNCTSSWQCTKPTPSSPQKKKLGYKTHFCFCEPGKMKFGKIISLVSLEDLLIKLHQANWREERDRQSWRTHTVREWGKKKRWGKEIGSRRGPRRKGPKWTALCRSFSRTGDQTKQLWNRNQKIQYVHLQLREDWTCCNFVSTLKHSNRRGIFHLSNSGARSKSSHLLQCVEAIKTQKVRVITATRAKEKADSTTPQHNLFDIRLFFPTFTLFVRNPPPYFTSSLTPQRTTRLSLSHTHSLFVLLFLFSHSLSLTLFSLHTPHSPGTKRTKRKPRKQKKRKHAPHHHRHQQRNTTPAHVLSILGPAYPPFFPCIDPTNTTTQHYPTQQKRSHRQLEKHEAPHSLEINV